MMRVGMLTSGGDCQALNATMLSGFECNNERRCEDTV